MKFKAPTLAEEFERIHPELRRALTGFDAWSHAKGFPEVVVTHVMRTPTFQESTYWQKLAKETGLAEAEARALARRKFSWHLIGCAADLRNTHYSEEQLDDAMAWFAANCTEPLFEVKRHDVGRGDHIHVGRRDYSWRTEFSKGGAHA